MKDTSTCISKSKPSRNIIGRWIRSKVIGLATSITIGEMVKFLKGVWNTKKIDKRWLISIWKVQRLWWVYSRLLQGMITITNATKERNRMMNSKEDTNITLNGIKIPSKMKSMLKTYLTFILIRTRLFKP